MSDKKLWSPSTTRNNINKFTNYINKEVNINSYEDLPQKENGVGSIRSFLKAMDEATINRGSITAQLSFVLAWQSLRSRVR